MLVSVALVLDVLELVPSGEVTLLRRVPVTDVLVSTLLLVLLPVVVPVLSLVPP